MDALPPLAAFATADPPALILPFVLLLALIAVMPLTPPRVRRLWDHYYRHAAIGLGLLVVGYYLVKLSGGAIVARTLHEYFSFICLIGSLFVVAGGIHLKVKGAATPRDNVVLLAIAAVAANLIGTTGASMVLIRPWIRMNELRISAFHVVFFIFIVSNCGGALTPIGDPPLFLGYLRGVPFFWLVDHIVGEWLLTVGLMLAVFCAFDCRSFTRAPRALQAKINEYDTWRFEGAVNIVFLLVIIGAVFLPETIFLRELVMVGAAAASFKLTPKIIHEENHFTFGPVREVAILFLGIFLTMMPALGYLQQHGRDFGFTRPIQYYFACGSLSSVLDNAPTYLNFLQLAEATLVDKAALPPGSGGEIAADAGVKQLIASERARKFIIAISLGSVFFGAMTYIGNGPNLMVKTIAENAGVKMPTFFGYVFKFSLPFLLPLLVAEGLLFL
jgi:Na+/H+ antiporter NhaD/arsenite permease-like protein